MCGRISGYQRGWSFGFSNYVHFSYNIDQPYVSGISLTHGHAGRRTHIWSFAAASTESASTNPTWQCPCSNINVTNFQTPPYVGNDYFCDSGNNGSDGDISLFFKEDPLWDGEGCGPTSTCCSLHSPPWFCKALPQPTSDNLEIRLCTVYYSTHEDKIISLIDIYVR